MSDKIIAQKTDKHFAVAVGPAVAKLPKFARSVPSSGPVTVPFGKSILTTTKTQANGNLIFINLSKAIGIGPEVFTPTESDSKNPVEMGLACYHGHAGIIIAPKGIANAPPIEALIHAGLTDPHADCKNRLAVAISQMADKAMEEIGSPIDFYKKFNAAETGVINKALNDYKSLGQSVLDGIKGAASAAGRYVTDSAYRGGVNSQAADLANSLPGKAQNLYNSTVQGASELLDEAKQLASLSKEEMSEAVQEWLTEQLGELPCDAASAAEDMLKSGKPVAQMLGELSGEVKVQVAEVGLSVAAGAVTGGAGAVAMRSATVARMAKTAKSAGGLIDKSSDMLGKLRKKFGDKAAKKKAGGDPSKTKPAAADAKPKEQPTPASSSVDKGNKADGGACPLDCKPKVAKGSPVNAVLGCKVLSGEPDFDFALPALMPLVWQRIYVSSNPAIGWLGQGWTIPSSLYVETTRTSTDVVDDKGRRIKFPLLEVGKQFFSRFEGFSLHRADDNSYFIKSLDGQIQEFTSASKAKYKKFCLANILDANQNTISYRYDEKTGLLAGVTDSAGRQFAFEFAKYTTSKKDKGDRLKAIKLLQHDKAPLALVSYDYNSDGDLIAVRNQQNQITREFAYQDHLMVKHSRPGGLVAQYEYNSTQAAKARVVRHWDNLGGQWAFEYTRGQTKVTDVLGRTDYLLSNKDKELTGYVNFDGSKIHRELDDYKNLLAETDELGRTTQYDYNQYSQISRIKRPDGGSTTLHYDAQNHQVSEVTDTLGHSTHYTYDKRGNLVRVTDALQQSTHYELDPQGLPVRITDAKGGIAQLAYNPAGQVTSYTDCSQQTTHYRYDSLGNLLDVTNALGHSTRYEYDALSRLVALHPADGSTERYAYDSQGRLVTHTDAAGQSTRYELRADGLPTQRTNALGKTLRYDYDPAGRLAQLINENGAAYAFSYDNRDRLIKEQGFDGRTTQYHYNSASELLQKTEAPGAPGIPSAADTTQAPHAIHTHYQRDAAGRVLQKRIGKTTTQYCYSPLGQLIAAKNQHSHIQLAYDALGQLTSELAQNHGTSSQLQHQYDPLGNRTSTTLPDGRVINHLYYGSGHLHQINLDGEVISDMERDALHREVNRSQGQLHSQYGYDSMGRLTQQSIQQSIQNNGIYPLKPAIAPVDIAQAAIKTGAGGVADANSLITRRYQYDALGQLQSQHSQRAGRAGHSQHYQYDALGRLEEASLQTGSGSTNGSGSHSQHERFAFDPAHNLVDESQASIATSANNNNNASQGSVPGRYENNRLVVYQDKRYRYDQHGNLVEKKIGAHTRIDLHWDDEHQLQKSIKTTQTNTTKPHSEETRYAYDAFGRRVSKTDALGTAHYHWDGNRLLGERKGQRSVLYIYEPGSFAPLAQVETVQVQVGNVRTATANNTLTAQPLQAGNPASTAQIALPIAKPVVKLASSQRGISATSYVIDSNKPAQEAGQTSQPGQLGQLGGFALGGLGGLGSLGVAANETGQPAAPASAAAPQLTSQTVPFGDTAQSAQPAQSGFGALGMGAGLGLGAQSVATATPAAPAAAKPATAATTTLATVVTTTGATTILGTQSPDQENKTAVGTSLVRATSYTKDSEALAQIISPPAAPELPTFKTIQRIHYYQNDQLGTPQELTSSQGDIRWSATYKAWGNTLKVEWVASNEALEPQDLAANDPVHQPIRFQGQYFDQETGLHYNRFRYYDPDVGRFVSQDPIGLAGGNNVYQYAPNPIGWIDPLGLCKDCPPCGGTATVHWLDNRGPGNAFGHYTVAVELAGAVLHTEQLGMPGTKTTIATNGSGTTQTSAQIQLPDAKAAQDLQKSKLDKLGPDYDTKHRSCITHVGDVLRAGGVPVPTEPGGQFKFIKKLFIK